MALNASRSRRAHKRGAGYSTDEGWDPVPSVTITIIGGRPFAVSSAISPPHPRLSSSACGANTITLLPFVIVSKLAIGRWRSSEITSAARLTILNAQFRHSSR